MAEISWWKRYRLWIYTFFILLIIFFSIVYSFIGEVIPHYAALYAKPSIYEKPFNNRVKNNEEVIAVFGDSLKILNIINGEIMFTKNNSQCAVAIPIQGTKNRGVMDVISIKEGGNWETIKVVVRIKKPIEKRIIIYKKETLTD